MEGSSVLHASEEIDSLPQILHPSNILFPGNIALHLVKQNRYLLLNIYSCSNYCCSWKQEILKEALSCHIGMKCFHRNWSC